MALNETKRSQSEEDDEPRVTLIAGWKEENRRGPTGRPETFPVRAVLVAMALAADSRQSMLVTTFCRVMFHQISPAMRSELEIPDRPAQGDKRAWDDIYRNVRYRTHRLLDLVDPSPYPKNRRLTPDEFDAAVERRLAERSQDDLDTRRDRLEWLANQIVESSIRVLPRDIRRQWRGSGAIDATVVAAYARGTSNHRGSTGFTKEVRLHSADPDAAWYHRESDRRNVDSAETASSHSIWGFDLSLFVSGADDPDAAPAIPSLVMAMVLDRPGFAPGGNAVRALSSIVRARGHPAGWLAGDRAYTHATPENFHLPVRELGFRTVLDYRDINSAFRVRSRASRPSKARCTAQRCPMFWPTPPSITARGTSTRPPTGGGWKSGSSTACDPRRRRTRRATSGSCIRLAGLRLWPAVSRSPPR